MLGSDMAHNYRLIELKFQQKSEFFNKMNYYFIH
jgi:hypothetical protein